MKLVKVGVYTSEITNKIAMAKIKERMRNECGGERSEPPAMP